MADVLARRIRKRGCDRRVAAPLASERAGNASLRADAKWQRGSGSGHSVLPSLLASSLVLLPEGTGLRADIGSVVTAAGEMRMRGGVFGTAEAAGTVSDALDSAAERSGATGSRTILPDWPEPVRGPFCRRERRPFGRYFVFPVIFSVIFFVSLYQDRDSFRFCKSNESRFRACYSLNPNEEKEKSATKAERDGFCHGSHWPLSPSV